MNLSSDEMEYLWHVAKRSNIKLRKPMLRQRLVALGLVRLEAGWPTLTAAGQKVIRDSQIDLWRKLEDHCFVSPSDRPHALALS